METIILSLIDMNLILGKKIISISITQSIEMFDREGKKYFVAGYKTVCEDNYKIIYGGGGAQGRDLIQMWIIDPFDYIIGYYEEYLCY